MKVLLVTHFASPYQVEFFNEISAQNKIDLTVVYLHKTFVGRQWQTKSFLHKAICLDENRSGMRDAQDLIRSVDFAVLNYYAEEPSRILLSDRAQSGLPWTFWGERPGYAQFGFLGRLMRRWRLSAVHRTCVPIWGIGRFGVDGYKLEFGSRRTYFNLPYFSDLTRFNNSSHKFRSADLITFLFSGEFISRKGVDLLARAFVRLAANNKRVRLKLMGKGDLRQQLETTLSPVSDKVEFLGFKSWDDLPGSYAEADVLCVPSRYDGWGLVVPEGLASGLPVITTDRTGSAIEFIREGRNGWLVQANNENSLLAAMSKAAGLADHELRAMRVAAKESVAEHSLENGAVRFVDYATTAVIDWENARV